jgi:Protein of unknown function (DUF1194)
LSGLRKDARYQWLCGWQRRAGAVVAIACAAIVLSSAHAARPTANVDLALVLALDVSGSVDEDEFDLQRQGLAKAFLNPAIIAAIRSGANKRIAVTVVQWAGFGHQHVSLPWTVIGDTGSASRFAARLAVMRRRYPGGVTHLTGVMEFATRLVLAAPFVAERQVIDISGDGENNVEKEPDEARNAAVRAGVTVNGLAIVNANADLLAYYRARVIGGPGAFVVSATDYDDFPRAILLKLLREIDRQFTT